MSTKQQIDKQFLYIDGEEKHCEVGINWLGRWYFRVMLDNSLLSLWFAGIHLYHTLSPVFLTCRRRLTLKWFK